VLPVHELRIDFRMFLKVGVGIRFSMVFETAKKLNLRNSALASARAFFWLGWVTDG